MNRKTQSSGFLLVFHSPGLWISNKFHQYLHQYRISLDESSCGFRIPSCERTQRRITAPKKSAERTDPGPRGLTRGFKFAQTFSTLGPRFHLPHTLSSSILPHRYGESRRDLQSHTCYVLTFYWLGNSPSRQPYFVGS